MACVMARIKDIPTRPEIKRTAVYCLGWAWTAGWETGHLTYLYMTEKCSLYGLHFFCLLIHVEKGGFWYRNGR